MSLAGEAALELFGRLKAHRVWGWDESYGVTDVPNRPETDEPDLTKADILSSELRGAANCLETRHVVALDIDYPAHLLPSTTGDHYHLYLDVPGGIAHDDYMELLALLGRLGVIEEGYAGASVRRGYSSLRPPWVEKGRPIMRCVVCQKRPDEIDEYLPDAQPDQPGISPDDFVWHNEGTLSRATGRFACTACYVKIGMPSSDTGWTGDNYSTPLPLGTFL